MGVLSLEIQKGLYLGIDFGTTNSVLSIYNYDEQKVQVLPIDGSKLFPTAIQFEEGDEDGTLQKIYGIEAKEGAIIYPESTVISIKRRLESDEPVTIQLGETTYSFDNETIVSQLLAYMKEQADMYIRDVLSIMGNFSGCVITVPANSTDKFKKKMKIAAVMAGFLEEHVHLRLEPAAAAITYANEIEGERKVLVYDFGGGTFDACLLSIEEDEGEPSINIMSTYGDNYLGGDDLDQIIADMIYDEFLKQVDGAVDLYDDSETDTMTNRDKKTAIYRMKQAATEAKEKLSAANTCQIVLAPFIQLPVPVNIRIELTRESFYNHSRKYPLDDPEWVFERTKGKTATELIDRTIECVNKCLEDSQLAKEDIDEVFLVGGSSSIPLVKERLEAHFGQEPYQSKVSPAFSISQGAALYCNQIMLPSLSGPKVHETTIHSLGLEISGRRYMEIIPKGLAIPEDGLTVEAPYTFETGMDDLTSLAIAVYEDVEPEESKTRFVYDSTMKRLGGTTLRHIPVGKKGQEKIKVIFNINRDNILTVEAFALNEEGSKTVLRVDELYEK